MIWPFYVCALVALVSTLRVVTNTNPVHGLLSLIVSLLAVAGMFFGLGAAFAGVLEIHHLHDNRKRLNHKDAAHDGEYDFLPDDDSNRAQRGAQCQGTDIAHEHLRRMGVEPQKCQACTCHGRTKYQQLT